MSWMLDLGLNLPSKTPYNQDYCLFRAYSCKKKKKKPSARIPGADPEKAVSYLPSVNTWII